MNNNLKIGDIVEFQLDDGKKYRGEIVQFLEEKNLVYIHHEYYRLFVSRDRLKPIAVYQ